MVKSLSEKRTELFLEINSKEIIPYSILNNILIKVYEQDEEFIKKIGRIDFLKIFQDYKYFGRIDEVNNAIIREIIKLAGKDFIGDFR